MLRFKRDHRKDLFFFYVLYAARRKGFFNFLKEVQRLSANFEAKKLVVEEITSKIKASKAVVLVDYNKLTVAEVSELRNKCREAGCEYKVYKNTLVRKAFNDMGVKDFDEALNGPTAIAFSADEVTAAKLMVKSAKDYDTKIVVKCGYVDNAYVDKKGVEALATMPSREELVAKMLGSMQAPLSNCAGVLNNLVSGIVRVLARVAENKA